MPKSSVLRVEGLGKQYRLYATPGARLKALIGWVDHHTAHWALNGVSFNLQPGQCLGVVGDNGAGKSTLLKLLAGTLHPSHGRVNRVGRVTAILELGAGFHPDFTGRQNLLFGGALIGLEAAEMQRLADGIIAFAELQDAIDRPVKTYSSGMVVRLAFALVTAVQPEVLIIDEALAVGDQHFQKKCIHRIDTFRQNGCTVLFCSHSLYHVRQLCDRVLWLDNGRMQAFGETELVLAQYETHVRLQDAAKKPVAEPQGHLPAAEQTNTGEQTATTIQSTAKLLDARIPAHLLDTQSSTGRLKATDLVVEVRAQASSAEMPSVGVLLEQYLGVGITSLATHSDGVALTAVSTQNGFTTWQVSLTFTELPLHSGQYALSFYLFDAKGLVVYDEWKNHIVFDWISPSLTPGLVRLPHRWS